MKRIIRLTESDLLKLVKRVIKENYEKEPYITAIVVEILPEFIEKLELGGDKSWFQREWIYDKGIRTIKLKDYKEMYLGALKNNTDENPEFKFTHITLKFVASRKEIIYIEYNTKEFFQGGGNILDTDSWVDDLKLDAGS